MTDFSYSEVFRLAVPESMLVVGALLVLLNDLTVIRGRTSAQRSAFHATLTSATCLAGMAWLQIMPQAGAVADGMIVMNPTIALVKQAILLLTAFTALISWRVEFTRHLGEYFALLLLATVGMLFLASARHLLMLFVALELTSLALYILVAFHKESRASAEAALKYFLFGGMAAAFTLFGLSLVYGLAGSLSFSGIAEGVVGREPDMLFQVALVMALVGLGFKVAVAPFHLWAPDVYQGAPTPAAALIASGSKVAGFFVLVSLLLGGFGTLAGDAGWGRFMPGWQPVLAIFAALSMVIGNLVALNQTRVKRLLAYSAIAHGGYALVGVMANSAEGVSAVVYYAVTYALATLGAFAVVQVVEGDAGDDRLESFAGLRERSPVLALCLMVFMLSAAGIPPLAGFFGKFYVFTAAVKTGSADLGLIWLVAIGVLMSAVSFYYYLQVLKRAFVASAPDGFSPLRVQPAVLAVILLIALGVVWFGCQPSVLLGPLSDGSPPLSP
ncbi:MAG TPA: NADH-quinone oxidoreductase subunit N [Verrucomicrobiales bacterium]|nr:NADH-quinone oxidoreductase subunit N [Verrucomicrobiales bacterium]